MNLSYDNFKKGKRRYYSNLDGHFYFNGSKIFKPKNGECIQQIDRHFLPLAGFFPDIVIYDIKRKINSNLSHKSLLHIH